MANTPPPRRQTKQAPSNVTGYGGSLWFLNRDMERHHPVPGAVPAGVTINGEYVPYNSNNPQHQAMYKQIVAKPNPVVQGTLVHRDDPDSQKQLMKMDALRSKEPSVPPQKHTHVFSGGDADVKQYIVNKGFHNPLKLAVAGSPSSAFNEIVTGEVLQMLWSDSSLKDNPEKIASILYLRFRNTELGRELCNGNVIRFDPPDPAKGDEGLYVRCLVTARCGITEFHSAMQALNTMKWTRDLAGVQHFCGANDSKAILSEIIEKADKIHAFSGEVIDYDFIQEIIDSMGSATNPADTVTLIQNHDGNVAIKFTSNKQAVKSIQSNSSLSKELDRYKEYLKKIHLYPNEQAAADKIIETAKVRLKKLNGIAKSTSAFIADFILADPDLVEGLHRAMLTKSPSDTKRQVRYKKWVAQMFSSDNIKYNDKSGRAIEYLQRAGWSTGMPITKDVKIRAFLEYAKDDSFSKDASKLLLRSAALLSPVPPAKDIVSDVKQSIIEEYYSMLNKLNRIPVKSGIPLGLYIEAENILERLNLNSGLEDADNPIYKIDSLFTVNMGGIELNRQSIRSVIGIVSKKAFINNLHVMFGKAVDTNVNGRGVITYELTRNGKRIPFARKIIRTKENSVSSLMTTYEWHPVIQKRFREMGQ